MLRMNCQERGASGLPGINPPLQFHYNIDGNHDYGYVHRGKIMHDCYSMNAIYNEIHDDFTRRRNLLYACVLRRVSLLSRKSLIDLRMR